MSGVDDLLARLQAGFPGNSEEHQILADAGVRATFLGARKLAGEDVDQELAVVAATCANLSVAAKDKAYQMAMTWVGEILSGAIRTGLGITA